MDKTLSLVIPCLNEEQAVPIVLKAVGEVRRLFIEELGFKDVQVIVVDDASQDGSVNLIRSFSFVDLVQHPQTSGYGASLRTGFQHARGQWICFLDMDDSYPPHHIPFMWHLLVSDQLDMVLGRRSFGAQGMSFVRGFGNWFFSQLTRVILNTNIQDVCSGFRLFRRECLPDILDITESTLGYSLEMSIRLSSLGWKTKEYGINYLPRKGSSKLSVWKDGWTFLLLILAAAKKVHLQKGISR